jgi:hypothetical protein
MFLGRELFAPFQQQLYSRLSWVQRRSPECRIKIVSLFDWKLFVKTNLIRHHCRGGTIFKCVRSLMTLLIASFVSTYSCQPNFLFRSMATDRPHLPLISPSINPKVSLVLSPNGLSFNPCLVLISSHAFSTSGFLLHSRKLNDDLTTPGPPKPRGDVLCGMLAVAYAAGSSAGLPAGM